MRCRKIIHRILIAAALAMTLFITTAAQAESGCHRNEGGTDTGSKTTQPPDR